MRTLFFWLTAAGVALVVNLVLVKCGPSLFRALNG